MAEKQPSECPMCASRNISFSEREHAIMCRDCGSVIAGKPVVLELPREEVVREIFPGAKKAKKVVKKAKKSKKSKAKPKKKPAKKVVKKAKKAVAKKKPAKKVVKKAKKSFIRRFLRR